MPSRWRVNSFDKSTNNEGSLLSTPQLARRFREPAVLRSISCIHVQKTLFDGKLPSICDEQNNRTKPNTKSSPLLRSPAVAHSWRIHPQHNWESQPRRVMWHSSPPAPTTFFPYIAHLPRMNQRLHDCHRLVVFITTIYYKPPDWDLWPFCVFTSMRMLAVINLLAPELFF